MSVKPDDKQDRALVDLQERYLTGELSRRSFVKLLGGLTLTGTAGSLLAACNSSSSPSNSGTTAKPKHGGTLTAALTGQPDQLDPQTSAIYTAAQIYDNIFDKLITLEPSGKFAPALASSWKQLDPKTWEFHLVHNAVFHNNEPFTANDVRFTFERMLNPKTASSYAPLFAPISHVQVVDKYTVRFHLKHPFGPLLTNLANNGEIMNAKAVSTFDPKRHPVGTGAFKFKEWVSGDHVTVVRWPHYFERNKPYLDQVKFKGAPVDESRMAALKNGEFNWVDAVPLQDVSRLAKGTNPVYKTAHNAGIPDYLSLVVDKPPFNNKKLRQAVAWAINKEEILKAAYFGVGEIGSEEVPTGSPWYTNNDPYRRGPDIAKAERLLHEAGYPKGLTIEYLGLPQYPELLKTGEVVKEQLAKIGITMNIKQLEVTVWGNRFVKRQYQM